MSKLLSTFILLSIFILPFTATAGIRYVLSNSENGLRAFASQDELRNFILAGLKRGEINRLILPSFGFDIAGGARALTQGVLGPTKESNTEYSATNVQVAGVDEADIVKTDGKFIYAASGSKFFIVDAYPANTMKLVSATRVNGTILGLFVNRDRLVVFEQSGSNYPLPLSTPSGTKMPTLVPVGSPGVNLRVFDLSNREKPVQLREIFLDGNYVSSRMIGDWAYAVVSQPAVYWIEQRQEVVPPRIYANGQLQVVPPTEVHYSKSSDIPSTYTIIVAVNTQTEVETPKYQIVLTGYATTMFVSGSNIYLIMPKGSWWMGEGSTIIYRIAVDGPNIIAESSGEVRGRVLNQYSMDEYEGNFRISTSTAGTGQNLSANNVYILDMDMRIVGRLENLAQGEQIHSARFMGTRCYLVTFKKVDPLFTIDLGNPREPRVLGKLKIPGYSDYLHPYDSNHLIGIGKETVEAKEGDFAWYQGLKVSFFDVSDVANPKETSNFIIGDRGTDSPVLRDPHALLFDKAQNLLVIPVLEARIFPEKYPQGVPPFTYGDFVFQGVYVFRVTPQQGISRIGAITHIDDPQTYLKSGYYFSSTGEIKRSLYIGNVLYTVSDTKVEADSLKDLSEIAWVKLVSP